MEAAEVSADLLAEIAPPPITSLVISLPWFCFPLEQRPPPGFLQGTAPLGQKLPEDRALSSPFPLKP